ncbi:uncharacterized protein LOC128983015 [Macrosteles quadrilineatus]|uniref:uncharacterized protein LOC128983015 n=1 Tax=Macrosteles quadrilineatus TaxID=74068 RepID=UPI0023E33A66|nr:uncharacterized protein LOC128983015 [Macrosteles quadrilineatus]
MDDDNQLPSLRGVQFTETILSAESKVTPYRHFEIPPSQDSEPPLGPLALLSFLSPTSSVINNSGSYLRDTLTAHFNTGIFLHAKEKGALYPVIHFTEDRNALKKRLSGEDTLGNEFLLYQGVYREVRSIRPEGVILNGHRSSVESTAYIVMGFKSLDKNFSQNVMVDSWKEWTGARNIYMNLPDELGLSRISFYHREAPDSLNMFLYVVLVECTSVDTIEHQMKLIDFAQRLRAERMTACVTVYGVTLVD